MNLCVTDSPAPRRIAYFTNVYPAVSHTFIRREIEALEEQGWDVARFAIRKSADLVDEMDRIEADRTSCLLPVRLGELTIACLLSLARPNRLLRATAMAVRMALRDQRGFTRAMFALPEALVLRSRLRRRGLGHTHGHFGTNGVTVLRLVKALGGPTYSFTVHGTAELDNPSACSLAEKTADAEFVVAVSHYARAQLYRLVPSESWSRIALVRCGLRLGHDDAGPPPACKQFLCVGRLSPEKGHIFVLRAMARLVEEDSDVRLLIVGDGELRASLQAEIKRLQLEKSVKLLGWQDEAQVTGWLNRSRALVLPSLGEGLPVVLMEAFRARRPAIAANIGGVGELVRPGRTGWLFPPGDVDAMVDCLRAVLSAAPSELAAMGEAGRGLVAAQHDVVREAAELGRWFEAATHREIDRLPGESRDAMATTLDGAFSRESKGLA